MGRMHSDAQLTLFSSFSLGKINKFLLRSLVRRFQHTLTQSTVLRTSACHTAKEHLTIYKSNGVYYARKFHCSS